jgi:FtsP/CotA-like multicopper oxidase with cupredoxin domain
MGLYGNVVVDPIKADYWPPSDREYVVTLDDVLIEDGRIAAFNLDGPTHVAMGRFGNVMLTAGETSPTWAANAGEVVRFYFTNTANTRLFNVVLPGARMKRIGGDSGRYEHESFVDELLLAPSERALVDVLFDSPGSYNLEHRTPDHTYVLGTARVGDSAIDGPSGTFELLRTDTEMTRERRRIEGDRQREADKTLAFRSVMPLLYGDTDSATERWTCPMHPEVISDAPGTCPHCGMKLIPLQQESASAWTCPMHPEVISDAPGTCPHCGMRLIQVEAETRSVAEHRHDPAHSHHAPDGLEWEDLMPDINRTSDASNMTWKLVDLDNGTENENIDWTFQVGDRIKIRLENGMEQDHPMHHPFHVHGAGRFLVLARDGRADENLVWKDTVLVRAGETVDILLEITNPGIWMAHCHIAEHNQAGMMFSFRVTEAAGR